MRVCRFVVFRFLVSCITLFSCLTRNWDFDLSEKRSTFIFELGFYAMADSQGVQGVQ